MTSKKIKTPYFSVQYLLREFAKGLGTKALAGKKIDDACKNAEINPYHLDALKQELIHEPLTKYVNISFADHVLEQFESITEAYLNLIKSVPLDGVNADLAQQFIERYFMTFAVAEICSSSLDGMRLTPRDIAWSDKTLMSLVLAKLESSTEWQQFLIKSTEPQKECLRAWSLGPGAELPKLASIASLGEKWQRGNSWGTFKARLITARLWDYFFYRSGYTDLAMLKHNFPNQCLETLVNQMLKLLHQGAVKYEATSPLALGLFDLLRLRKPKAADCQGRCLELLNQLRQQQEKLDTNKETTYYYHWMNARYLLHSGELLAAVDEYKLAFEQVIYRQGENAEKIIVEAIVAACRCPKPNKRFINRLRRMAVVLKIDLMPPEHGNDEYKAKPQEIESWEVAAFSQYFSAFFTRESFFPDAPYPKSPHDNNGVWMVDETVQLLDLKKPDKVFSVGMEGGLVKQMPQLVYFSMLEDGDAISTLLDSGADVNLLSSRNESAILLAVQSMQVNVMPLNSMRDESFKLLSQKPHKRSVLDTLTEKKKLSPLGCAIQTGRLDVVRKLLEMGASVDRRHDIIGETPLFTAIGLIAHHSRPQLNAMHWDMRKYSEMNLQSVRAHSAGLLPHDLEHLKTVMARQESDPIFRSTYEVVKEIERSNIVRYTTADGFRQIAKLLIEQGADPNAKHDTAMLGYTPLMLAIELDEAELVEAMIDSKHHQVNFGDTCMDSLSRQRVDLDRLIRNWRSKKVYQMLIERFSD
ncbi:ankyrin repeat domain-containing protein [Vibrio parahaemolyticus O1:K58]|uniref:ankyrin repeat domain-containing protein n=1 Tax=Vibrio parahaemolyticus TaxID=670 RepID=UPI0006A6E693|nr:ankyrin repeat domain-containing protein [Vibrio parahaemolyticus]EJG0950706.1 ankyrin repeat domain-containing protein [Vibrio parahaemolyticus O1:K58]EHH1094054.1 ankyrin repeat domain-containing protein [Vibrio parahaemolyticus]EHV9722991.1 ankyrin repeat domain-containing protein [Vibrio parahaemolyticus]EIZ1367111.1 ankyrin repeat domain-containing protein [Vibrio parahaemolyticus]EKO5223473.1 ankyrin repeat domain-containing protein [Vibrio parahaemolyticus]